MVTNVIISSSFRSETSGSNSEKGSPSTTPPGSTPSSSQGSPARYKLTGARKLANTRSSPQLILNQIHEESEVEGSSPRVLHPVDPVDNFPQTSAGVAVIRRLEQRRRFKFHKSRTTSCSSSECSDDESREGPEKRPPRPEKTPTPPPSLNKDPHDDSSDSNQDPGTASTASNLANLAISASRSSRSRSNETSNSKTQTSSKSHDHKRSTDTYKKAAAGSNRGTTLNRVRQSRSLNRISELHVVADFSENEDLLTRYLRPQRSRDDSLTSSDGEFEELKPQPNNRRQKVNLRLLEQRLNKIKEENTNDGDISDNVSIKEDFKRIIIDTADKENCSESTSVKSLVYSKTKREPRLNRAHSCGSLFSLKERALLRKKLSNTVTAAFWDILSSAAAAKEAEVNKQQPVNTAELASLALKTNPLAVFQLHSTSRCCNLC